MEDYLDRYVKYLIAERNASPYTVRNYSREIRDFMDFARAHGVHSWDAVKPALLRRWLAHWAEGGYAKASVARRVSELRAFYRFLHAHDLVPENPVEAISAPKLPRRLPRPLTEAETHALLAAPDPTTPQGQRDRAMVELLYAGGLRVGELLALDVTSIDLEHREVRVLGKGAKERITVIGVPAVEALKVYLADGRERLLSRGVEEKRSGGAEERGSGGAEEKRGGGVEESSPPPLLHSSSPPPRRRTRALFLNRDGARLSVSMFTRRLGQYAREAGITRPVTPHMLRHTFATDLLDGGADLRSVQELLGHESVATTQIYTEVSQSHLRDTVLGAHPRARPAANPSQPRPSTGSPGVRRDPGTGVPSDSQHGASPEEGDE